MAMVVPESELDHVRALYRLTAYGGEVQLGDIVVGAWRGPDLFEAVRIVTEHGVLVLRGMRVQPQFQRQGIGTEILGEVRLLLDGIECFAIAYPHLKDFYSRIGFVPATSATHRPSCGTGSIRIAPKIRNKDSFSSERQRENRGGTGADDCKLMRAFARFDRGH